MTQGSEGVEFADFADEEGIESRPLRSAEEEELTPRRMLWLALLPLGFAFLLTLLFMAMRGVLDLGGMVAFGGPYKIAHPAPAFWWIFPVSIIGMILIFFTSIGMFSMLPMSGIKSSLVALLFWPAVFLSLGWNFLEYGFFKTGGLAWGWIVCGVAFVAIGSYPVYRVLGKNGAGPLVGTVKIIRKDLWPQAAGLAAGISLGLLLFSAVY